MQIQYTVCEENQRYGRTMEYGTERSTEVDSGILGKRVQAHGTGQFLYGVTRQSLVLFVVVLSDQFQQSFSMNQESFYLHKIGKTTGIGYVCKCRYIVYRSWKRRRLYITQMTKKLRIQLNYLLLRKELLFLTLKMYSIARTTNTSSSQWMMILGKPIIAKQF